MYAKQQIIWNISHIVPQHIDFQSIECTNSHIVPQHIDFQSIECTNSHVRNKNKKIRNCPQFFVCSIYDGFDRILAECVVDRIP